jgi:recombination protein RecR
LASNVLPRPVQRLIDEFARLPGIGPKSASRLTFYLLRSADEQAADLAAALQELKTSTQLCQRCFNITEENPCPICLDEARQADLLCVVEEPLDVVAIERSRAYHGRYHVLHGVISPVEGIDPDDLKHRRTGPPGRAGAASRRSSSPPMPPWKGIPRPCTCSGAWRVGYPVDRLARGLPMGGDLEYTDEITLGRAWKAGRMTHLEGGSGWESNPPPLALRDRPPVLKTGASTGTQPLPWLGPDYSQWRPNRQLNSGWKTGSIPKANLTAAHPLDRITLLYDNRWLPAGIAQLVEHCTENAGVPSSSLGPGTLKNTVRV